MSGCIFDSLMLLPIPCIYLYHLTLLVLSAGRYPCVTMYIYCIISCIMLKLYIYRFMLCLFVAALRDVLTNQLTIISQTRDASEGSSQHVLKGQKSSQPEIEKTTFVSKRPFCKLLKEKQNGGTLVCITCIDLTAPFLHGIVQTLINEVRAKHCGIASHLKVCHCLELEESSSRLHLLRRQPIDRG